MKRYFLGLLFLLLLAGGVQFAAADFTCEPCSQWIGNTNYNSCESCRCYCGFYWADTIPFNGVIESGSCQYLGDPNDCATYNDPNVFFEPSYYYHQETCCEIYKPGCDWSSSYGGACTNEVPYVIPETTVVRCHNNLDDDQDGNTDCDDSDCYDLGSENCVNDIDDDCDQYIDECDDECYAAEICTDGLDNDCDSSIDCADDDCACCGNQLLQGEEQCEKLNSTTWGNGCVIGACWCDTGFEPYNPPQKNCQALCGNGAINGGEECDGGTGCSACECIDGYNPATPPALSCLVIPSDPCDAFDESRSWFEIQGSTGTTLMRIDQNGVMCIRGVVQGTWAEPSGNDFVIQNASGSAVIRLDQPTGDLYIRGNVFNNSGSPILGPPLYHGNFIIKNKKGKDVAWFESSGNIHISNAEVGTCQFGGGSSCGSS
ncbi:MAG: hypothetical protein ACP5N3_04600 [Candidatus Nanoarchaeia archaeon]